jgi:hypothetical protein
VRPYFGRSIMAMLLARTQVEAGAAMVGTSATVSLYASHPGMKYSRGNSLCRSCAPL